MRENFEFRIPEDLVGNLFGDFEGKKIGPWVRKIVISPSDKRFFQIGKLNYEFHQQNRYFFSSWNVIRNYTKLEIESASLFLFKPLAYFEPAGEDCGTIYDDGPACACCLAGAKQVTPLFLPVRKIPRKPDIAKTIAGEVVINQRLADLFKDHGVTGTSLGTVRQRGAKDLRPLGWYQLLPQPPYAEVIAPTRTGITPFDEDSKNEYRCPNGDTIGLNYLSEITINAASRSQADIVATRQFVGRRAGYLRPERSILISQKVRRILEENRIKGYRLEVAHVI